MAEETDLEFVSKMDYVLELPDVIRKGAYSGKTVNGIPNGFGVFETTNSSGINWHYIGQWENGEIKGDGGMYWDNGREEIGIFKENNLLCGTIRDGTGNYAWINYEPNEHGHYEAKEYRDDGSIRCECCIDGQISADFWGYISPGDPRRAAILARNANRLTLTQTEEEELLNAGVIPRATVLKVGHHGRDDATGKALMAAVRPQWAIISTSSQERPDTPAAETLKLFQVKTAVTQEAQVGILAELENQTATVWRVDWDGKHPLEK